MILNTKIKIFTPYEASDERKIGPTDDIIKTCTEENKIFDYDFNHKGLCPVYNGLVKFFGCWNGCDF